MGVKQVQAQRALFTEDTVFVFLWHKSSTVMSRRLLIGQDALRQAFLDYNRFIGGGQPLTMSYRDI